MKLLIFLHRVFSTAKTKGSIGFMRRISIVGVTIAVAALVIVVSTTAGFRRSYRKAILDFNAHVAVMSYGTPVDADAASSELSELFVNDDEVAFYKRWKLLLPIIRVAPRLFGEFGKKLIALEGKGLVAMTTFAYEETLVASARGVRGVVIKGVDPRTVRDVNKMELSFIKGGIVDALSVDTLSVVIGSALAKELDVTPGQAVKVFIPDSGEFIKAHVNGIFSSGLYDYDSKFILISMGSFRKLFGNALTSGLELRLDDPMKAGAISRAIEKGYAHLGQPVTWYELNRDLFAAVKLEGVVLSLLVGTLVVAASLNIITVLVLFVIYRRREVAILAALGLNKRMRVRLFELCGLTTGIKGVFIGTLIGIVIGVLVDRFGFIRLAPDIYFVNHLPMDISVLPIGIIVVFSIAVCLTASYVAALRSTSLNIGDALKGH